ncbi:MAG TPA: hypothetical protein VNJ51_03500 [Candidatus Dormibacteraeota bacterium]|nr:hypothetical protein [Candidatus Dormibacteraeota bacterium]
MSEQFEYRFVTAWASDASDLVAAGADGWEAVGMVPAENGLLILMKREIAREDEEDDEDQEEEEEEEDEEEAEEEERFPRGRCRRMRKNVEVVHVHLHRGCC